MGQVPFSKSSEPPIYSAAYFLTGWAIELGSRQVDLGARSARSDHYLSSSTTRLTFPAVIFSAENLLATTPCFLVRSSIQLTA